MKNKILYSLILLGYIMTGCNEPENNGFSDFNLENNTNLNIDTVYVSGTDVLIKDLYNGSTLNYSLSNIQEHSIFVNNLKYNLTATASEPNKKCFIYNGVRYFGDIISEPLLYCDDTSKFVKTETIYNNYKYNLKIDSITDDILVPLKPDSFDGFYLEHGNENEMAIMAMPIIITNSINDTIPKYVNYIKENEIIKSIGRGTPNIMGTVIISEMKIKTKMKIGAMSLLNILTNTIMKGDKLTPPNTFLSSSNGRTSNDFTVQINMKITTNKKDDPIGFNIVIGVFANKVTNNNTEFESEDNLMKKWRKLASPFNVKENLKI